MKIKERIAKLVDVKSIITLTLTEVFAYMNVAGIDVPETFKTIYIMIIGFYFGTQSQSKNKEDN